MKTPLLPGKSGRRGIPSDMMRILAVDTATPIVSAAVGDGCRLLAEKTVSRGETHSKHLMGLIDGVLAAAGIRLGDLNGFAVTRGPGSFTGLRIGISTIKGLALATGKPLVGVSSLRALAGQAIPTPYVICPLIDARKNEVYFCRFRFQGGRLERVSDPRVGAVGEALKGIVEPCLFIGNGALLYRQTIGDTLGESARFAGVDRHTLRASTILRVSLSRFAGNDTDPLDTFAPVYIRKSDAQLHAGKANLPGR